VCETGPMQYLAVLCPSIVATIWSLCECWCHLKSSRVRLDPPTRSCCNL